MSKYVRLGQTEGCKEGTYIVNCIGYKKILGGEGFDGKTDAAKRRNLKSD